MYVMLLTRFRRNKQLHLSSKISIIEPLKHVTIAVPFFDKKRLGSN